MTHAELLAAITVYWNSGVERSPEGLADDLWGNWQQLRILKRAAKEKARVKPLNPQPKQNSASLTPRLLQVLALVADGLQDHEIADRLGTSINTVHHQEASIRRKLGGLRNRAAMTRWYAEHMPAVRHVTGIVVQKSERPELIISE